MRRSIPFYATSILFAALLFSAGCNKSEGSSSTPSYSIPDTYDFTNADSSGAKVILSMLANIEAAINAGNTRGNRVSSTDLKAMFSNQNHLFRDTAFNSVTYDLNASGEQLKSHTLPSAQAFVESIFDSVGSDSQSDEEAANGVAGVSSRKTLLSANGIYWRQFFTKTMMGVLIGHMITDTYLGDSLNGSISNEAKQHAWDQAFYMWCVPANFPANRAGVKYWGSYTSQVDSGIAKPVTSLTGINANLRLTSAFIKGRAALANNDLPTASQQADTIINMFETLEAAAALHELNEAKEGLSNGPAAVCGFLSESVGFWTALKYNLHKKTSDADYNAVLALYGTNFYNITPQGIDAILDKISSIYGWDAVKSNL